MPALCSLKRKYAFKDIVKQLKNCFKTTLLACDPFDVFVYDYF